MHLVEHHLNVGQRVLVLDSLLVQHAVVNDETELFGIPGFGDHQAGSSVRAGRRSYVALSHQGLYTVPQLTELF